MAKYTIQDLSDTSKTLEVEGFVVLDGKETDFQDYDAIFWLNDGETLDCLEGFNGLKFLIVKFSEYRKAKALKELGY